MVNVKNIGFIIMVVFLFSMISSVSATTYYVNESWTNDMIQDLFDKPDLTDLHFNNSLDGLYKDLSLDITKSVTISCDYGVILRGNIENFVFHAFNILIDDIIVKNLIITGYSTALHSEGFNNISIINNTFTENDNNIEFISSDNITLFNNSINNSIGEGVSISNSKNLNITNNNIENVSTGIHIKNSNNTTIEWNNLSKNTYKGIEVDSNYNLSIKNNEINSSDDSNIFVSGSKDVSISNNKIFDSGSDGISIQNSEKTIIEDNIIENNKGDGIYSFNSANSTIKKNKIKENIHSGVSLDSSNNDYNNGMVSIINRSSHDVNVSDNNIENNRGSGIFAKYPIDFILVITQ